MDTASFSNLPWSWDTVPLWADFGTQNTSLLTDYQAQFTATHYDIISIEKCLGSPAKTGIPTEVSFYKIASKMRQYATPSETKILFYFASDVAFCSCYDITTSFCNNQSMIFKDDAGNPLYDGNGVPYYDHTQSYVRQWWTNTLVDVMKTAKEQYGVVVNGVFADTFNAFFHPNQNVSEQRVDELREAKKKLGTETMAAFAEINDDTFLMANALNTYTNLMPSGTEFFPYVDGLLGEHFGAFEEVMNAENGKINVTDLLFWFDVGQSLASNTYGEDKALLIKAWIGPETGPFTKLGPSWPSTYSRPTPNSSLEIQQASLDLITFPLAVYLCGMYQKYSYLSYAWFYDVDQYAPCPDDPSSCDVPPGFYPEFMQKLGEPVTNGFMTYQTKCNRSFENAQVYVDLNDDLSAQIQWLS